MKLNNIVLTLLAIAFPSSVFAGNSCPPVTQVSSGRGNIHTEVMDVATGHLRAISYVRTFMNGGNAFAVIGSGSACPQQGCAPDPAGQHQDCTATSPNVPLFDWVLTAAGGVEQPTQSSGLDLKQPSGTVILDQSSGPAPGHGTCPIMTTGGTHGMLTAVADSNSGLIFNIASIRIYSKTHPNSSLVDFYTVIAANFSGGGVGPIPPGQMQDCTQQGSPWYDMYWSRDGTTNSESIVPDTLYNGAALQFNQGN
jgi:hypothetical protein